VAVEKDSGNANVSLHIDGPKGCVEEASGMRCFLVVLGGVVGLVVGAILGMHLGSLLSGGASFETHIGFLCGLFGGPFVGMVALPLLVSVAQRLIRAKR